MATNTVGIDKEVEVDRKENLRDHRLYWIGRRTQDVILSSLALVVLSPVMLATAIAIVVDDPSAGPVFSQERIGRNGKPFKFYKFRSMCPNAEAKLDDLLDQNEMDGPVFKIKDDPRITRVGKFIRKTSIDELPQLWNILKGDMSIVGPRPALPREVEQYGDYEKQRLYVTPGLSCYWQIAPHRNDLSFEEWMDLDVKYVKERSFWVDITHMDGRLTCDALRRKRQCTQLLKRLPLHSVIRLSAFQKRKSSLHWIKRFAERKSCKLSLTVWISRPMKMACMVQLKGET